MGLFPSSKDFKDGPGVEKDTPRKKGIGRFFELVGRDMSSMFLANLLTCIGFLPVICLVYIGFLMNNLTVMIVSAIAGGILAGPALAGMYDTVLRALRDEAGYWWTTYRRAFRQNFKASILPGILYCVVVTVQIFLVYFCFNMLYHGTNVGVPLWVATVLNLLIFQMLFAYMWPQIALLDQPLSLTLKNSINCMIAFLPHALAASIVQILFWGVVILCMPLGLLLMLIFGFWFVTEVSCQIIYGDIEKVFHIEESIRKMKDAELEAALACEGDERERRVAAGDEQIDGAVVQDPEHGLRRPGAKRVVQGREQELEHERDAHEDGGDHVGGACARHGRADDEKNERRYREEGADAVAHGVRDLLARAVLAWRPSEHRCVPRCHVLLPWLRGDVAWRRHRMSSGSSKSSRGRSGRLYHAVMRALLCSLIWCSIQVFLLWTMASISSTTSSTLPGRALMRYAVIWRMALADLSSPDMT